MDVVFVIKKWVLNTLANSFRSSKVNHALNIGMLLKKLSNLMFFSEIYLFKSRVFMSNLSNTFENFNRRIRQVVCNNHVKILLLQFHNSMRTYISEPSGNKNLHNL